MAYLPFLKTRSQNYQHQTFTAPVANFLGIPDPPKFLPGDRVKWSYFCDDEIDPDNFGRTITIYGTVLWLMPDRKGKHWEYFCHFDNEHPNSFDYDLPYLDNEIEFE